MDKQTIYTILQTILSNRVNYSLPSWIIEEMEQWLNEFNADFQLNQIECPFELIKRLSLIPIMTYKGRTCAPGTNPLAMSMCWETKHDQKRTEFCFFLSACHRFCNLEQ